MILLDTNVISEVMKETPDPQVVAWTDRQSAAQLFITAITESELRYGVALLPPGRRRDRISAALEAMLLEEFHEHILPFDSAAAVAFAGIAAQRRQAGKPIAQLDAQIAALASSHAATLATRNITDFAGCGIALVNPWEARD